LLGLEECQKVSLLLRHLRPAETYNLTRKKCYVGKHWLPKRSTILISYLPFSDICLTQCGTGWG
jgi:hypothetical protein